MSNMTTTGIAIVSALLILVAIFAVGVGALFLSQTNIGVSANVQSNAIAQSNADAGLDASFVALEVRYRAEGVLPSEISTTSATGVNFSSTHDLTTYTRLSDDSAVVGVTGIGPNQAEHVSEATIRMIPSESRPPPAWAFGLASEATCQTNGVSTFINAGIHCNGGYNLGNRDAYGVCMERAVDGTCLRYETIAVGDAPVSASPGATLCSPRDLCEDGRPRTLIDPIEIDPNYASKRDAAILAASSGTATSTVFGIDCDDVYAAPSDIDWNALAPSTTICVESSADIVVPAAPGLVGVTLIAQGNVTLDAGVTLNESTIISTTGAVEAASNGNANVTLVDSSIYSERDIRLNGQQSSFEGLTTLASGGSITVNGGAPATSGPDGETGVGLVLLAEGDVRVNGSGEWFVAVLAGGTFTQEGNSQLYGNIASRGAMVFNGGVDIDAGLPILNDDGNTIILARLAVTSRR